MTKKSRLNFLLTITVIFVFIFSLFSTVNVLADDSTPPMPTEEPVLTSTEEPAAETESDPTSVSEADTPAEIFESAPDGVDVVVLDENGQAISLTTAEAAQVIMNGDPMWCPDGDTPGTDALDSIIECTPSYTSFSALITELETNSSAYVGSGTIYVAYDYNATIAGEAGTIILFDYGNVELTDLVVQGGWNFASDSVFGTSTIDLGPGGSVEFWNWGAYGVPGSLTLRDIIINSGDGLYITDNGFDYTTADVSLSNVDVVGTDYGAYILTEGNVTISDSNFNNTQSDAGLIVENGGSITLNNVAANGNYDTGAILDNGCGCTLDNIFISSSTFDSNGIGFGDGRGLIAYSNGDIALANVSASGNAGGGAELDNSFGFGNISLTGANVFNNNGFNLAPSVGLWTLSNGNITLSGVTASGNGSLAGGGAFIMSSVGNVAITNSDFSNNCIFLCDAGIGFVAGTSAGTITLNQVISNGNGDATNGFVGLGAVIFNDGGNVFVTNSNFNNNCASGSCAGGGIQIEMTSGNVYFDHVAANGNGSIGAGGAFIGSSGGNVEIYCSSFSNNAGYGLTVDIPSGSTITLNGVSFGANVSGDIDLYDGTLVVNPFDCDPIKSGNKNLSSPSGLPLNIVDVTSGQSVELDCEHFSGTKLVLANGNSALFPCPIKDSASLVDDKIEDLPGLLPDGNTFQSAFTVSASKNGENLAKLSGNATISFMIPEGVDASKLAILFWDGTDWVNVENTFITEGTYFEALVNSTGIFVLVQK